HAARGGGGREGGGDRQRRGRQERLREDGVDGGSRRILDRSRGAQVQGHRLDRGGGVGSRDGVGGRGGRAGRRRRPGRQRSAVTRAPASGRGGLARRGPGGGGGEGRVDQARADGVPQAAHAQRISPRSADRREAQDVIARAEEEGRRHGRAGRRRQ